MPRQNRVTPFSTLIATPARGTLMGNRGCLHDAHGQIRRPFQGQRWIVCLLAFKGRKRPLMWPGHYTELFFLDEATALAAGHRPCAECQRERFNLFRELWATANPELTNTRRPTATVLDAYLHQERLVTSPEARHRCHSIETLPDGTFVTDAEHTAYLVLKKQLWRWKPTGYDHQPEYSHHNPTMYVLTPASVMRVLALGYPVGIHPTAFPGREQSV